eukprot:jgi/Ulvmu1/5858/UM025_0120.1
MRGCAQVIMDPWRGGEDGCCGACCAQGSADPGGAVWQSGARCGNGCDMMCAVFWQTRFSAGESINQPGLFMMDWEGAPGAAADSVRNKTQSGRRCVEELCL